MKSSPGPWRVEQRRDEDRENPDYFAIVDADGKCIFDTLNSEDVRVDTETDGDDGSYSHWDEQGLINCNLIVELWKLYEILTKGSA